MKNHFTGKEIKDLSKAKNFDTLVFRINGNYQQLDFIYRSGIGAPDELKSIIEIKTEINLDQHCFVYLFAGQKDTTWQFFVEALKPKDRVMFFSRSNLSSKLEEHGIKTFELRANVRRYKSDETTLLKVLETTIRRENV